jgi:hypothetical protein
LAKVGAPQVETEELFQRPRRDGMSAQRRARSGVTRSPSEKSRPDDTLTSCEELFALEYLANGYNATAAYKVTHPRCRSANAAAVEAHRLLRKPKIATFIQHEQQARNRRLRMDADEATRRRGDLRTVETELERLTAAIASGGDIPALLAAVREREAARTALRAQMEALKRPAIDPVKLKADLRERLADWRGLLTRYIPQARQILRKLLTSAITLTPTGQAKPRRYEFHLEASLAKLFGANMVASPPGFEPGFQP